MGHHMKNTCSISTYTKGKEHESELTDGGIGQNFLDIILFQRNRCSKQGSGNADDGDKVL